MGTRNLTCVYHENTYKIAQYGQFDGYPSCAGITLLNTLKTFSRKQILEVLSRVSFIEDEDAYYRHQAKLLGMAGNLEWVTVEQSNRLKELFPETHRTTGYGILDLLLTDERFRNGDIKLINSFEFSKNMTWCEWIYVIDLDKNTFEVYSLFSEGEENDRFKHKRVGMFELNPDFDILPTEDEFLSVVDPEEDDDEYEE